MEQQKFLRLNDIEAYKLSFALSNHVWQITSTWNNFAKDTVGKQFVRAADSIPANIAEGFGRFSKKFFGWHKDPCMKPLIGTKNLK